MKRKHRITWSALLLAAGLALTGCGEAPLELTEAEQQTIAQYAAHVVSKYNTKQRAGIVHMEPSSEEPETEAETEQPEPETEAHQPEGNGTGGEASEQENHGSLTEILGLGSVEASYTGAELASSWEEGGIIALTPPEGKQYLVLHFVLHNSGSEDAVCDILSTRSVFQVSWNGEKIPAQTTILLSDLGTYQGTIPAGGDAETVLVFEVPLSGEDPADNIALQIIYNEVRWNVDLMQW